VKQTVKQAVKHRCHTVRSTIARPNSRG